MNTNIKQQWITALRNGEFVQGRETLRPTEDTYCCLGVLCELQGHRPIVNKEGEQVQLWKLNDIDKLSFTEIADLIEVSL
jgi:hypothetical protein